MTKRDSEMPASALCVLNAEEIAQVSGGVDKPIVVKGTMMKVWSGIIEYGNWGEPNPTLNPVGEEGGGGGGGDYIEVDPAAATPCVTAAPAGVSLAEINNVAKAITHDIASKNDGSWEYGSIIYAVGGAIGLTDTVTQNRIDRVNYPFHLVPPNAVVLALVDNQPNQYGEDERIPSSTDWQTYEGLVSGQTPLPNGITVDPNMLMYVYTDQDFKTRVYDKNDKNTQSPQCAL